MPASRAGIPLAAVLTAFPVVVVQGLRVRRATPRLPEAAGTRGTVGDGDAPLQVVVLGDSVAAGVGLQDHTDSLAGQVSTRLAAATARPVAWSVLAQGGLTAAGVRALADETVLRGAAVVVVSVGVNDTKDLHGDRRWRTELGALLDTVLVRAPAAKVVLLGVPPMDRFPALPRPLSSILGARSRRLDALGREVCAERPRVVRLELDLDGGVEFAADGFHPSVGFHARCADQVVALADGADLRMPPTR